MEAVRRKLAYKVNINDDYLSLLDELLVNIDLPPNVETHKLICIFLDECLALLVTGCGCTVRRTLGFNDVKKALVTFIPTGILYYKMIYSLELLSKKLGEQLVRESPNLSDITSDGLLNKIRAHMMDIIVSRVIFLSNEKRCLLSSPTTYEYANPVVAACFDVLYNISMYIQFIIQAHLINPAKKGNLNFLELLFMDWQLAPLFNQTRIFQSLLKKSCMDKILKRRTSKMYELKTENYDNSSFDSQSTEGLEYAHAYEFGYLMKHYIDQTFPRQPKKKVSLMKKLTLTKVTKFGAYDADEKMHFFLRASPEWDHMSFEELLESGKTLITPLETSLTTNNTYEVEKLEDYFSNTMHSKYFRGTADVDGNVGEEKPLYVSQEIYEVLNKRTNDMGDFNETSSYKVTGESNERLGLIRGSSYHRRAKSLSSMDRFSCFKPSNLLKNPKSYLQSLVLQTKCNILAPGKKKDSV